MKNLANRPPRDHYQSYFVENNSVMYTTKDDQKVVTTGLAWVEEAVRDPKTDYRSYLVSAAPVVGEPTTIRIGAKEMGSSARLQEMIGNLGVIVHEAAHLRKFLLLTAAHGTFAKGNPRILIDMPGWLADGQGFFTGTEPITAPALDASSFRFEPVPRSPFAVRGALDDWYDATGQHIERNFLVLGATCLSCASPFLANLGLSSRIVNFWGSKGTGKTLAVQCAGTLYGSGADPASGQFHEHPPFVTKFATTFNGIEPLLARYAPLPLLLDELTEQEGESLGPMMYKVSSGEGKHRMSANGEAAKSYRWLQTVITTSERSLADAMTAGGKPVLGGMFDRAVDIAIDETGVFQDFGELGDRQSLFKHLKKACGQFYGSPGHAILNYAVCNPEAVQERLNEAEDIEERLLPDGCGDGERRVVKLFAAAAAAGNIAVDAGVFRCGSEVIEDAMRRITDIWWRTRGGVLRTIATHLETHYDEVLIQAPSFNAHAVAFLHNGNVIIPEAEFNLAFGDQAKKMVQDLAGLNALVREQPNRTKHRFCNNRMFAYVIPIARIEPFMSGDDSAEDDVTDDGNQGDLEAMFD